MSENTTLVIGLGAQKAGTTWLYDYFISHPQFFASPIKEINFFTSYLNHEDYPHVREGFLARYYEHVKSYSSRPLKTYTEKLRNLSDRVLMDFYPNNYLKFFSNRINNEKCFGEISPSYADLSSEAFRYMRSIYPSVKFIFIMRDPVDRFISHIKFDKKLGLGDIDSIKQKAIMTKSIHLRRSQYDLTIKKIENIVPPCDIKYLFYEEMFNVESITNLCDFLQIDYHDAAFSRFSNKNQITDKNILSERERLEIKKLLATTYDFCTEKFSISIPTSWNIY